MIFFERPKLELSYLEGVEWATCYQIKSDILDLMELMFVFGDLFLLCFQLRSHLLIWFSRGHSFDSSVTQIYLLNFLVELSYCLEQLNPLFLEFLTAKDGL